MILLYDIFLAMVSIPMCHDSDATLLVSVIAIMVSFAEHGFIDTISILYLWYLAMLSPLCPKMVIVETRLYGHFTRCQGQTGDTCKRVTSLWYGNNATNMF